MLHSRGAVGSFLIVSRGPRSKKSQTWSSWFTSPTLDKQFFQEWVSGVLRSYEMCHLAFGKHFIQKKRKLAQPRYYTHLTVLQLPELYLASIQRTELNASLQGMGEYLTVHASRSSCLKPQVSSPSASPDGGLLPPEIPFWQYLNKTSACWPFTVPPD